VVAGDLTDLDGARRSYFITYNENEVLRPIFGLALFVRRSSAFSRSLPLVPSISAYGRLTRRPHRNGLGRLRPYGAGLHL